ncbi:hypothetical protein ACFVS2_22220 [Brevibacillus sp. NPDC058079]|uniref:BC1872 family protein n=1 Tax=Brevibacillus sp. NPDC058079 TaxID=3346330 RepID=UPI0036E7C3A4
MRKVVIDKQIATHVLNMRDRIVDAENSIGLTEDFGGVRAFEPSLSLDHAMEAATAIGLFEEGYALHYMKGTYTQVWAWQISRVDDRGVLQGFAHGETPAMAICNACLSKVGIVPGL